MTRSELDDRFSCDAEGAMNEIDPVTGSMKTRLKHSLQSIRAMSRKHSGGTCRLMKRDPILPVLVSKR